MEITGNSSGHKDIVSILTVGLLQTQLLDHLTARCVADLRLASKAACRAIDSHKNCLHLDPAALSRTVLVDRQRHNRCTSVQYRSSFAAALRRWPALQHTLVSNSGGRELTPWLVHELVQEVALHDKHAGSGSSPVMPRLMHMLAGLRWPPRFAPLPKQAGTGGPTTGSASAVGVEPSTDYGHGSGSGTWLSSMSIHDAVSIPPVTDDWASTSPLQQFYGPPSNTDWAVLCALCEHVMCGEMHMQQALPQLRKRLDAIVHSPLAPGVECEYLEWGSCMYLRCKLSETEPGISSAEGQHRQPQGNLHESSGQQQQATPSVADRLSAQQHAWSVMAAASELRGLGLWLAYEAARAARVNITAAAGGAQSPEALLDDASSIAQLLAAHTPASYITAAAWEVASLVALLTLSFNRGGKRTARLAALIRAMSVLQSCRVSLDQGYCPAVLEELAQYASTQSIARDPQVHAVMIVMGLTWHAQPGFPGQGKYRPSTAGAKGMASGSAAFDKASPMREVSFLDRHPLLRARSSEGGKARSDSAVMKTGRSFVQLIAQLAKGSVGVALQSGVHAAVCERGGIHAWEHLLASQGWLVHVAAHGNGSALSFRGLSAAGILPPDEQLPDKVYTELALTRGPHPAAVIEQPVMIASYDRSPAAQAGATLCTEQSAGSRRQPGNAHLMHTPLDIAATPASATATAATHKQKASNMASSPSTVEGPLASASSSAAAGAAIVAAAASGSCQAMTKGKSKGNQRKKDKQLSADMALTVGQAASSSQLHADTVSSLQFREALRSSLIKAHAHGLHQWQGGTAAVVSNKHILPLLMAVVSAAPEHELRAVVSLEGANAVCMQLLGLPRLYHPDAEELADIPHYPFHDLYDYETDMCGGRESEDSELKAAALELLELARSAPARPLQPFVGLPQAKPQKTEAPGTAAARVGSKGHGKGGRGGRGGGAQGGKGSVEPAGLGGTASSSSSGLGLGNSSGSSSQHAGRPEVMLLLLPIHCALQASDAARRKGRSMVSCCDPACVSDSMLAYAAACTPGGISVQQLEWLLGRKAQPDQQQQEGGNFKQHRQAGKGVMSSQFRAADVSAWKPWAVAAVALVLNGHAEHAYALAMQRLPTSVCGLVLGPALFCAAARSLIALRDEHRLMQAAGRPMGQHQLLARDAPAGSGPGMSVPVNTLAQLSVQDGRKKLVLVDETGSHTFAGSSHGSTAQLSDVKDEGLKRSIVLLQHILLQDAEGLMHVFNLMAPRSEFEYGSITSYAEKQAEVLDGSPQAWVWEQGRQALLELVCGEADVAVDAFVQYAAYEGAMAQWEEYVSDGDTYYTDSDGHYYEDDDDDGLFEDDD